MTGRNRTDIERDNRKVRRRLALQRARQSLAIGGTILIVLGFMCMPVGIGVNPKRNLSAFLQLADIGMFIKIGLVFMGLGTALILLSRLIPSGD